MTSSPDTLPAPHGRRRPRRTTLIAIAVAAVVGTTGAVSSATGSPSDAETIYAEFTNISPIDAGSQVKMNGVTIGTVGEPSYDQVRRIAVVPLQVDRSALPIHSDARVTQGALSLLGERFLELTPGTDAAPVLGPEAHLPTSQTGSKQDFQDILNVLDDPTAAGVAALATTLGQGVDGQGRDVAATLAALEPAMNDTDALVSVLAQQNQLLDRVVTSVEPVTSALATDDGRRLDGLVGSTTDLLGSTAARDAQLRETLVELPSTLSEAQRTLGELTGTARATTTTLGNLRPTTDNLEAISREIGAFSDAADPALASAQPVLERADALLAQARPVVADLRAGGPALRESAAGAKPIVADLNDNLGNVLSFVRYWALATNGRDGVSHYFRAMYIGSTMPVTGVLPGDGLNLAPDPGTQTEPTPREGTTEGPNSTGDPGGRAAGDAEQAPASDGSATGLTPEQEQGGIGMLLGGN